MPLYGSEKPIGAFYYHWQYTRPPTLCGMVEWRRHLRVDIHRSQGETTGRLTYRVSPNRTWQASGDEMI